MSIDKHYEEHIGLQTNPLKTAHRAGLPYGSWMSDTFSGADIYAMGFDKRPTVFFDPSATSSLGWGTYKQPFKNVTEVNTWIATKSGAVAGQVLGIKRGSLLRGGWSMTAVYGTSASPFYIIPYGDAEAMPIISGGSVYTLTENPTTGWATVSGTGGLIFKKTLSAEADVFDQSYSAVIKRMYKVAGAANEAAAIAALTTPGTSCWVNSATMLYVYPFAGTPDWTQVEVMNAAIAFGLYISDVASTGYVTAAGIHVRGARDTAFGVAMGGTVNVATGISVIGCRFGQGGYDNSGTSLGSNGLRVYGGSESVRMGTLKIIGNYAYDNQNNSMELANISSADIWGNRLLDSHGNALELYYSTSLCLFHDNYGTGDYLGHTPLTGFGSNAIRLFGYLSTDQVNTWAAQNTGNEYYRNVLLNFKGGISHRGAAGKAYQNTIYAKTNSGGDGYSINVPNTTNGTNALEIKNNLLVGTGTSGNCGMVLTGNAVTVISAKNVEYLPGGTYLNYVAGATYTSLATYNTNQTTNQGGSPTCATVALNPTFAADGYTPTLAGIFNAGDVLAGYSERDWVGRPMLANGTDTLPAYGAVARP